MEPDFVFDNRCAQPGRSTLKLQVPAVSAPGFFSAEKKPGAKTEISQSVEGVGSSYLEGVQLW